MTILGQVVGSCQLLVVSCQSGVCRRVRWGKPHLALGVEVEEVDDLHAGLLQRRQDVSRCRIDGVRTSARPDSQHFRIDTRLVGGRHHQELDASFGQVVAKSHDRGEDVVCSDAARRCVAGILPAIRGRDALDTFFRCPCGHTTNGQRTRFDEKLNGRAVEDQPERPSRAWSPASWRRTKRAYWTQRRGRLRQAALALQITFKPPEVRSRRGLAEQARDLWRLPLAQFDADLGRRDNADQDEEDHDQADMRPATWRHRSTPKELTIRVWVPNRDDSRLGALPCLPALRSHVFHAGQDMPTRRTHGTQKRRRRFFFPPATQRLRDSQ